MTSSEIVSTDHSAVNGGNTASVTRRIMTWKPILALGLLVLTGFGFRASPLFEPPVLPPPATGNETRYSNSVSWLSPPPGFSMAFPKGWTVVNHPLPGGSMALTYGRPPEKAHSSQVMRVSISDPATSIYNYAARQTLPSHKTTFQNHDATLRISRFHRGKTFMQNIKRIWQRRSFGHWQRGETHAHWNLEFDHAGKRYTLQYSAPCGPYARIDATTVPPEILSYFETFEYTPVADALLGAPLNGSLGPDSSRD